MGRITDYFASLNLDIEKFLKSAGIMLAVSLVIALVGRFVFGKKSALLHAVSSAIGVLFIYAATIVLCGAGAKFQSFVAPLPFITIDGDYMVLFNFQAEYTVIATQILSMIILAFLMNLVDSILPTGKSVIIWILLRCASLVAGFVLHLIVTGLLTKWLPEGLVTYAPVILLGVLALMLLTGALKFIVGIALTTVNPLIAALYTFFFANVVGKQVTRAVLTTCILSALVFLLQKIGVVSIYIASAALAAYIPLILVLLLLWFVVGKLL